jgi:hypothetical protein
MQSNSEIATKRTLFQVTVADNPMKKREEYALSLRKNKKQGVIN